MMKKLLFFFCTISALCSPIINKWLPIVREKESFRKTFPKEQFQDKLCQEPPSWMTQQISDDLSPFQEKKISLHSLDSTYEIIRQKTDIPFPRYRILDNKLYKFVPQGAHFSKTDTTLEKALKTLLLYAKIPDVDFILCPMDGIPEPYMPEGFFLTGNEETQAPILAQAKLESAQYIALIPDQFSLHANWQTTSQEILKSNLKIQWSQKKEMAVWRGGLTDTGMPNGEPISDLTKSPRLTLCKQSLHFPEALDAGLSWIDDATKKLLAQEKVLKTGLDHEDHLLYKYLPVLDGHMCTYPGYQWRLLSNSVSFKQDSNQVQWFYKALQPYVHYIPIANDMGDLVTKIKWAQKHDLEVREIATQAQNFALHNLLMEDNYLYLALVLQRLASLEEINFNALKKETAQDPQWRCIQYRKRGSLQKSLQGLMNL
jgi:hypothetical protein